MKARATRHLGSEAVLLIALAALLVGATVVAESYASSRGDDLPSAPLSTHSNQAWGARALSLWLADLGYRPSAIEFKPFVVDSDARALFVLAPNVEVTESQASGIARWVERGGTLVVVAVEPSPLLDRIGVGIDEEGKQLSQAVAWQPAFQNPSLRPVDLKGAAPGLRLLGPDWVPLLGGGDPGDPVVLASARIGSGQAFVLSALYPLSNDGVGRGDNWTLVRHFLADVPDGSTIAFDEYHHGFTEHGTFGALLARSPWGWALLYAIGVLFAYTALRGRRPGRALPPPSLGTRRSRGEYVATLAAMLRQGGHRDWLAQQYAAQVKRALGARSRIRGDLPAQEFVAQLAARHPQAAALLAPLQRLERPGRTRDAAVVVLMAEIDRVSGRLVES